MSKTIGTLLILLVATLIFLAYQGDLPADVVDAKYTSPASQFLKTSNGARVHFRDEGASDGLPIILVHGSMSSLHTWTPWVAELGADYRVISLDLPAHGLTGAVPDDDYSAEAQQRTVEAVVKHLALEEFVIGGSSMGGGVAWRYALRHPQTVLGLILVSASGPRDWFDSESKSTPDQGAPLVFKLLGQDWFRAVAARIDPYLLAVQGAKSAYNNSPVVSDALIMRYYELALRAGTRDAILSRFDSSRQRSTPEPLTDLKMPTLILWGEKDSVIPASYAARFTEVLADSEAVVYPGVGHVPMEEIPKKSAQDVRRFLSSKIDRAKSTL